jgi:hypothetical protein
MKIDRIRSWHRPSLEELGIAGVSVRAGFADRELRRPRQSAVAVAEVDGSIVAAVYGVLLEVSPVGRVLHLEPADVRLPTPFDLEWRLRRRLLFRLLVHERRLSCWATQVSCVPRRLGQMALDAGFVHPSPLTPVEPSHEHLQIARAIDRHHRPECGISDGAEFDEGSFVYDGGGLGAERTEAHADEVLDRFYRRRLSTRGDAVLQVGRVDLATLAFFGRRRASLPGPIGGIGGRGARTPLPVPA